MHSLVIPHPLPPLRLPSFTPFISSVISLFQSALFPATGLFWGCGPCCRCSQLLLPPDATALHYSAILIGITLKRRRWQRARRLQRLQFDSAAISPNETSLMERHMVLHLSTAPPPPPSPPPPPPLSGPGCFSGLSAAV